METELMVRHIAWGSGTVLSCDEKYIRVAFGDGIGEKTFVYPDAFAKYIAYDDATLQAKVEEILAEIKAENEKKAAEAESARQEKLAAQSKDKTTLAMKKKAIAYSRKRAEKLRVKPSKKNDDGDEILRGNNEEEVEPDETVLDEIVELGGEDGK